MVISIIALVMGFLLNAWVLSRVAHAVRSPRGRFGFGVLCALVMALVTGILLAADYFAFTQRRRPEG